VSCLTKDGGVGATFVYVELPDATAETTSDGEAALVGQEGGSQAAVVGVHGHSLAGDAAGLSLVDDGSADAAVEDEGDLEIVG